MPGGGSKPGERRGGRQKGTPNKKTLQVAVLRERALAEARAQNALVDTRLMKLDTGPFDGDGHDLLAWTYRNPELPAQMRLEAARAAISYEKPKLSAAQNINIAASLRDLVLESMGLDAKPADARMVIEASAARGATPGRDAASGEIGLSTFRAQPEAKSLISATVTHDETMKTEPIAPSFKAIDAQPEPVPVQPAAEPDGVAGPALLQPRPPDGGKECMGTEGPPQPFGAPAAAGEARGPLPGPDRAMDSAQRFEELRREKEREREAEALRASQPNTRPYGEQARYSPRSEAAADVEFHVRRIRRGMGFPD